MYLIFGTIIVLIIIMFGSSIVSMIKSTASNAKNMNPSNKIGNIWFASLLIVNIFVIIFIYTFYYYKSNAVGTLGPTGNKGYAGIGGEPCYITIPNSKYYAPYTKIQ